MPLARVQVFVKGEFIGGSDILIEMHKAGELGQLAEELTGAAVTKQ
jgi:glutaredoxin-related protein